MQIMNIKSKEGRGTVNTLTVTDDVGLGKWEWQLRKKNSD